MKMNYKLWNSALALSLLIALAACSSSPDSEFDEGDDAEISEELPETAQATTDAVPAEGDLDKGLPPEVAQADSGAEAPPALDTPPEAAPAPDVAAAPVPEPAAVPAPAAEEAPIPAVEAPPAAEAVASQSTQRASHSASSGTGDFEDYSVQAGDTLMKVAFETYGDLYRWRDIYDANRDRVSDPNSIPVGTVLKVEKPSSPVTISRNGEKYLIKNGDTLGSISHEVYGTKTKWKKIWHNNRELIKDPNRIFAGFYLYYTIDEEDRRELAPQPMADSGAGETHSATAAAPAPETARMPAAEAAAAPPVQEQPVPAVPEAAAAAAPAPQAGG